MRFMEMETGGTRACALVFFLCRRVSFTSILANVSEVDAYATIVDTAIATNVAVV